MLPTKDHRDNCNFSTTGLGIKFQRSTFHRASAAHVPDDDDYDGDDDDDDDGLRALNKVTLFAV